MPQMVKKEIKVNELRKGDRVVEVAGASWIGADTDDAPVTDVTKKQTYAYVTREGHDRPLRVHLTTPVTVLRSEPTPEEKRAEEDKWKRDQLAGNLRKMLDDTPLMALGQIVDKARADNEPHVCDLLTWSNLPGVLKTQAVHQQALIIRGRLNRDGEHVNVDDATLDELIDAYAQWYYQNMNRAGRFGPRVDPMSRSTSPISNLLEDLDVWALGEVVYQITWSGARADVLARVEVFKNMSKSH